MSKSSKNSVRHIDLTSIKNPDFIKDLSNDELEVLCDDLRKYLLEVVSENGGHLSSNLGVAELTVGLLKEFDFSKDKIIFDVGHQSYIYKILTGRDFKTLRTTNGISGFQKRSESIYDHYEAGHSSTSISAASGMALARDLNHEHYDVISFIGDASIVNGLSFEGLNNAGTDGHKIIVVLNINDMSISEPSGGLAKMFRKLSTTRLYSRSKHFYKRILSKTRVTRFIYRITVKAKNWFSRRFVNQTIFGELGFKVIGPIDGHNLKEISKSLKAARRSDRSVVIMAKTLKGKGYEPAENDKLGTWHGVNKFNVETGEIYKDESKVSWSKLYCESLSKIMKDNEKCITICPATGLGSALYSLKKEFPSRFIDCGIAEEHALIYASGLGVSGYHPIISMYSTFLQRGYDEISHDLARMNISSTLLIDRAGLVGEDGETHQGIYDEQFLYGIPNTVITMASSEGQIDSLLKESLNDHGVFAIRYPRGSILKREIVKEDIPFGYWKDETISKTKKTAIVSYGYIINELKEKLSEHDVSLINAIYQKPLNSKKIEELLFYKNIIIYAPYSTKYGFASILSAALLEKGYKGKVIIKSLDDIYVKQGSVNEQLSSNGIDVDSIINLVTDIN